MDLFCSHCHVIYDGWLVFTLCSQCHRRRYCCFECQTSDWRTGHNQWCSRSGEISYDYEIRESEGKGLGVFALRKLYKGETIMAEKPLVKSDTAIATIHAAMMDLMPNDSDDINHKFALNSIGIGAASGEYHVFMSMSRVNHHCVGNSDHYYIAEHNVKILTATRFIDIGEEITFSYINFMTHPHWYIYLERKWKFSCKCSACTDPVTFGKLLQWQLLDQQITQLGQERQFERAMCVGKELLGLFDALHASPLLFTRTYYDMFQLAVARKCTLPQTHKYIHLAFESAALMFGDIHIKEVDRYRALAKDPTQHQAYLFGECKESYV